MWHLGATGLLLAMAAFAAQAARPVDNDGDGYTNNRDCDDNNPAVWELNSCGLCEVGPIGGCGGPTCTDSDRDNYAVEGGACGPIDCDDTDAAVNPGGAEICGDSIDNNCSGQIDEGCGGGGTSSRDVIVVATNDLGMHCACPGSEYFMLLPPFNTLRAQVIERGGRSPVVLDDPNDIRVEYDTVENTEESLRADPYYQTWMEMMPKYGFGPAENAQGLIQGLTGATLDGEMEAKTGEGWWEVIGVPLFPDVSDNSSLADKVMIDALGQDNPNRNPYLSVNVNVYDQSNDNLLASATTVAPVAFGGCCNCHLTVAENHGRPNPTPLDSFQVMGQLHEERSAVPADNTHPGIPGINIALIDPDGDGKPGPVRCSSCHLDPAMGESTPPGMLSTAEATKGQLMTDPNTDEPYRVSDFTFSDVLHRGHLENPAALAMDPNLAQNCYNCHPGNGVNCYRGHHATEIGTATLPDGTQVERPVIWCTDCHGDLHQRVAEGQMEQPWSEATLPACEDCHRNTGELSPDDSTYLHTGIFGRYLNSRGHKNDKILCSTCHGAPHALYPSNLAKDNHQIEVLQLGLASPIGICDVCHTGKSSTWRVPQH
jgi:hypothetical protein